MKDSETIQRLYQKQKDVNLKKESLGFLTSSESHRLVEVERGRVHNPLRVEAYFKEIISRDLVLQSSIGTVMEIMPPRKVVVTTSSKAMIQERKDLLIGLAALKLISGQKSQTTRAKKSIAAFKLREGGVLGCKVTLRGKGLYLFLEKLIFLALPRLQPSLGNQGIGADGTINIGVADPLLFRELEGHYDVFQSLRGINITLVTPICQRKVVELLLSGLQMKV